ncbi:uncharacterized protein JN550_013781 [Neoarthrinium moseri]|uniref:uncharacterized protein n=1 Tax=Neoarthrinium moseri TaxID=1658444 RepID=UPI001FDADCFF|nr:uncharacterized protein JN550_013781 [Neoarthrinium moseri]KAI1856498.1 hypothetical protein JN550_013781 [Neoarthrinium moseri]
MVRLRKLLSYSVVQPRAFALFQAGKDICRGTLKVKWILKSLNDCRDLGLSQEWLDRYEGAKIKYLVCAQVVLPEGPVSGKFEVGDILLELDGHLVKSLLQVETYMDDHVFESVTLTCWGAKGQFTVESEIEDLHAFSATYLLLAHGTMFHNLTFPMAICYNLPARGSVDGRPITDTTQLKAIMDRIWSSRDKPFICISQEKLRNPGNAEPVSGYLLQAIDQVSCDMTREPHQGGSWAITSMSLPKSTSSPFGKTGREQSTLWKDAGSKEELETRPDRLSSLQLADSDTPHKIVKIFSSFTLLNSHRDICIDGDSKSNRLVGVMFDVEKGLVFTSRDNLNLLDEVVMTVEGGQDVAASELERLQTRTNLKLIGSGLVVIKALWSAGWTASTARPRDTVSSTRSTASSRT